MLSQSSADKIGMPGCTDKPSAEKLLELLCLVSPCGTGDCDKRHHMATFIGPRFGLRERLLFVGYDHGKDYGECIGLTKRQEDMLNWRKKGEPWNGHYHGVVAQAAFFFGLHECERNCKNSCSWNGSPAINRTDCAYLHLSQANSVKSVPKGKTSMEWAQAHLIPNEVPVLLDEFRLIQPDVIIVHGKDNRRPLETAFADYLKWLETDFGHIDCPSFKSYIAFFRHPSRNQHAADWDLTISPTLRQIRERLSSPDISPR